MEIVSVSIIHGATFRVGDTPFPSGNDDWIVSKIQDTFLGQK
jgi:hypothetical protein